MRQCQDARRQRDHDGGTRTGRMTWRLGIDVGGHLHRPGPGLARRRRAHLQGAVDHRRLREAIIAGDAGADRAGRHRGRRRSARSSTAPRWPPTPSSSAAARATGLLTTEGFRDLLEIGRLRLSRLYDLDFERPAPLVPAPLAARGPRAHDHRGEVVTPLDRDGAAAAIDRLLAEGVRVDRGLLPPRLRRRRPTSQVGARSIRERAPHVALTLSSEILPEMREFERTSTAVTNAYVMPVMGRYLASLEGELRGARRSGRRSSSCSPTAAS